MSLNARLRRCSFVQGCGPRTRGHNYGGMGVGIFAAHTALTSRQPSEPLEPPVMGPPLPEGLKPHLKKGPLPGPPLEVGGILPAPHAMMEPQNKEMASDHAVHKLPGVPQAMPESSTWIIPFPYVTSSCTESIYANLDISRVMEERYMIFDGRNGGCKVGITTLPENVKFES